MATITVFDLKPEGYKLFSDSENYMTELSEDELGIEGGIAWTTVTISSKPCLAGAVAVGSFVASYIKGRFF